MAQRLDQFRDAERRRRHQRGRRNQGNRVSAQDGVRKG
jgi:hypothetical protein